MSAHYDEDRIVNFKAIIINNYIEKAHFKNSLNTRIDDSDNYYLHFDIWTRYVLCIDDDLYRCLRRGRRIKGDDQVFPVEEEYYN